MVLSQPTAVTIAEMSVIHEEKKVQDPEDDKVAQAEMLANEALRLATESKRAAEKLAEIRAAIAFLQSKSYAMPPVTVSKAEQREEAPASIPVMNPVVPAVVAPVVVQTPAPVAVQAPVAPAPVVVVAPVAPTPPVVVEAPIHSPVSILKKTELTVDVKTNEVPLEAVVSPSASTPVSILKRADSKAGAKEFRFSPEVVDPSVPAKVQPAPVQTITSVMSDDEPLIVKFCDALGMERLCSLEIEHDDDVVLTKDEKLAYIKNAFDMEAEGAGAYVAMARARAPVASSAPSTPAPSTPAPSTPESVASSAVEMPVPSTPVVIDSTVETPVAETQRVEIPTSEATATIDTKLTIETEAQPAETTAVAATMDADSSVVSTTGEGTLSPIKFQILANAIAPRVIHQPDPFAGEADDMDFTCGWGSV